MHYFSAFNMLGIFQSYLTMERIHLGLRNVLPY